MCSGQVFLFMQGWFPLFGSHTGAQAAASPQTEDKKNSWAEGWGQELEQGSYHPRATYSLGTPVKLGTGLWCNLHS